MKLDPQDFNYEEHDGQDSVKFGIYTDRSPSKPNTIPLPKEGANSGSLQNEPWRSKINWSSCTACFQSLEKERKAKPKCNRIIMKLNINDTGRVPDETMYRYFILSKKAKLLPHYVSARKSVDKKRIVFKMDEHDNNSLYMYLTTARMPYFSPLNVNAHVALMEKYGVDYYTACVIAFRMEMDNENHHFFAGKFGQYPETGVCIEEVQAIPMGAILAFIAYARNMADVPSASGNHWGFNCNYTIQKMWAYNNVTKAVTLQEILTKAYKSRIRKAIQRADKGDIKLDKI